MGAKLLFVVSHPDYGEELWRSDGTAAGTKRVKEINPGADSHPSYLTPMKIGTKHILFFRAYDSVHGAELWRSDGTAAGTKLVSDIVPGGGFSAPSDLRVMKIGTKRMLFFRADDGTSGEELWRSDGTAAGTKRVKDINPGTANSFPGDFTVMKVGTKRVLFFAASDGTSGRELWRSDGSGAGTRRVKDITAGGDGSTPSELVVMKVGTRQLLYLRASDAGGGSELWRSDGTKSGTRLAADIVPGAGGSDPYGFTVMKVGRRPVLFFGATDGSSGYELWRYRP